MLSVPDATDARAAAPRRTLLSFAKAPDAAFTTLLVLTIAFGVWLRVQRLAVPATLSFDEPFFVENARHYLAHQPDLNDHPPLGKLLIAAAMAVIGDSPVGWRVMPLLAGLLNIVLAFAVARRAFRSGRAGLLAAGLVAIDGFLVSYSRTALLDGMLTAVSLGALLMMVPPHRPGRIALAAALVGAAAGIKVSAFALLLPFLCVCLLSRRLPRWTVLLLGLTPLVFYAQYALGLWLTHAPASPSAAATSLRHALELHMTHTGTEHPASSLWYTWFLPWRPLPLRKDITPLGMETMMTTLGHPLLWWSSVLVIAGFALRHIVSAPRALERWWRRDESPEGDTTNSVAVVLLAWIAMLLPWIVTRRTSFIYHYLPSYAIGLILLAGAFDLLRRRLPTVAMMAVAVVASTAAFYAPVWGQIPLREEAASWRLFLEVWR